LTIDRTQKIEICHVITDLDVGGAEFMLKRLLEHNVLHRKTIAVVSLMGPGKIGEQLTSAGFKVYALDMQGKLAFPLALFRLTRLLNKMKPELIQTWMYHADLLGGLAAYFAGCKTIVWGIHCTRLPIGRPLTWVVMKLCSLLSRSIPSHIVCVAEAARLMHISYGYDASKMSVIPNGFEVEQFQPRFGAKRVLLDGAALNNRVVIGSVGRFHPDKGQDVLLVAAAQVVQTNPEVLFVLVGRLCDTSNLELQQLIEKYKISSNVLLLGERDDIAQLLPEFDVFCLPSRSEAFPVALGEAMLAGLPCVATDVGDCRVLNGEYSELVPPGDAALLAEAILAVIHKPKEEKHRLGIQGRQRVIDLFSIASVSERYQKLYTELLRRSAVDSTIHE
jgi:glycosyltransferase involved in cell wall biosynthesis